jgi:predicted nucleotidyltransferase
MTLDDIRRVIGPLCRDFNVRRLDVYGSVARGAATDASDLDLLVEFYEPDSQPSKRFFGFLHMLEDTLGCEIDLLTVTGLRNPYFKKRVLEERVVLYEG